MALEGCDCDLSWEMLGLACRIARTLGYFSVDTDQGEDRSLSPSVQNTIADDTETDKNQKRFVFWHLFRTDCFFRLAFRKPNLITKGCWKVNFPDLTINGIDDESFHLIQIHFLVSMRIALLSMKFLDWIDFQSTLDPASHDAVVEGYIEELHSILSNWHLVRHVLIVQSKYCLLKSHRRSCSEDHGRASIPIFVPTCFSAVTNYL